MPSYDKQKLLALMEARRAAHLALTDLGDRWRATRDSKAALASRIRAAAVEYRAPAGFVERLLSLPLAEASTLSADEVQGYERRSENTTYRHQTGVNFASFQRYIAIREKEEHLSAQFAVAGRDFDDRFSIVPRLRDAVLAWGFSDPELEAL